MTLLITFLAATTGTLVWYTNAEARQLKLGSLVLAYWSAALMWLVDSVVEYIEMGSEFFQPAAEDMINDAFLGFSVVILAMAVWVGYVIVKDPKGVFKRA